MNTTPDFSSPLGPALARYLVWKQSLGCRYVSERSILKSLDRFLAGGGESDLDERSFTAWCLTQDHLTTGVQRSRRRIVRNFCLYRRRSQPNCFVPDPVFFPAPHQPASPYILSPSEVARMIAQADALPRTFTSPLAPEVFRLALVLLYTTGLRRGEVVRLKIADYDEAERTLWIRASKFHKSRLLPLPDDVAEEIRRYLRARRRYHAVLEPEVPLLWNRKSGSGYTGAGLRDGLCRVMERTGIRKADGTLPRVHDMRHSFAVHALLRWYHDGVDVETKLPLLAAYLGHVSILSTYRYLHFVEPLRAASSLRFARSCATLIRPLPSPGGTES
jgi:integrase/recombinase XerD